MGNLTGKTEKSDTVGAFDKAGNVDTICILLGDVDPTAEKLYRSDVERYHLQLNLFEIYSGNNFECMNIYLYREPLITH